MERLIEGWLFDLYPLGDRMVVWIVSFGGEKVRLEDPWPYPLYARGDERALETFLRRARGEGAVGQVRRVQRTEFWSGKAIPVWEIEVRRYDLLPGLRKSLFDFEERARGPDSRGSSLSFWNVDLDPARYWLALHGLFPLARVRVAADGDRWVGSELLDGRDDVDWRLPPLTSSALTLERDPAIPLGRGNRLLWTSGGTTRVLEGDGWPEVLEALRALLLRDDPDLLVTDRGDTKILPVILEAAQRHRIELPLDREPHSPRRRRRTEGSTFFQYGKVIYKEPPFPLYGRWHLDRSTSFFHGEAGLEGLLEASRLSQVPVQQMARTSPGTGVSAMEVSLALSDGILVPWHKARGEDWKTADTLLTADKGGLVYMPPTGVHGDVVEVDFASMYPSLMVAHNLSAETVLCRCCRDDPEAPRVPESGYWICRRREGLVRRTLAPFLVKRARYKVLLKEACDPAERERIDARQTALKWFGVTSFGYLGYKNARFGKIESHEAVTAFGREAILTAKEIAEGSGFEVLHLLTDSLWARKPGVTSEEAHRLCEAITGAVGVTMALEGLYRWIAFLPSKVHPRVSVPNRYLGVFQEGKVKARGLLFRRHDCPPFIERVQQEMISLLAQAPDPEGYRTSVPSLIEILRARAQDLLDGKVPLEDLAVTTTLSRDPAGYRVENRTALAAREMGAWGVPLHAGEPVRYLLMRHDAPIKEERVRALPFLRPEDTADVAAYLDLLADAAWELLSPLGHDRAAVRRLIATRGNSAPSRARK